MKFLPPEAAIAVELRRRNVRIFHTGSPMTLIEAANEAIKRGISLEPRKGFLTREEFGLKLIALKGEIEADARLRGDDISGEEIARYSQDSPYIAIDLSAMHLLTPKEVKKVRLQVDLVKGLMRKLRRRNKLLLAEEPLEGRVIYLDPSAEEELEEVESGAIYVIGGVVDKGNRLSGISSQLASKRNAERRSIKLFGSTIGVTNTIVGIARILIYMFRGMPKDLAVLLTAPRRALKHRLLIEKDPKIRKALEKLLERRKGLTEYAEPPLEVLSRALYDLLFRTPYRRHRPI